MIGSIRRMLDQIENHREKDLNDFGPTKRADDGAFDFESVEKSLGGSSNMNSSSAMGSSSDVFSFLSGLEGN